VRWIVDTSAWSRRGIPDIAEQINAILDEDPANELVLTGPVLIEILREPQGEAVAAARAGLEGAMTVLAVTPAAQAAAVDALVVLAAYIITPMRTASRWLICSPRRWRTSTAAGSFTSTATSTCSPSTAA
jgi:predicted nucleic acid-binding protein